MAIFKVKRKRTSRLLYIGVVIVIFWFIATVCYLADLITYEIKSIKNKIYKSDPRDIGYFDHIDIPIILPFTQTTAAISHNEYTNNSESNVAQIQRHGYKIPDVKVTRSGDTIPRRKRSRAHHRHSATILAQIQRPLYAQKKRSNTLKLEGLFSRDAWLDVQHPYARHSFNVVASNALPMTRSLPDMRPQSCRRQMILRSLPSASVVICFHNEAWSTLLRTVHSVLATTPDALLKEVVLVDDNSTYDYLKTPLENHTKKLKKVYLYRTSKREGLTRARQMGYMKTTGEVVVFLDSHCECGVDWLPPLLKEISSDPSKVVCPQMDVIDHHTFKYTAGPDKVHGGLNWNMQFVWKRVPEAQRSGGPAQNIRSPTMAGGMFAINRKWFNHLGGFDTGMEIWGSENVELSLRIWMCGGSIQILPCSRVGHVFRPVIPYGFPGGPRKILRQNEIRVAETWLDEYRKYYYAIVREKIPGTIVKPAVTSRRQLRKRLHCHNFSWYLRHVIPEMPVPPVDARYFGQIQNKESATCLAVTGTPSQKRLSLVISECHNMDPSQIFILSEGGVMHWQDQCVCQKSGAVFQLGPCGSFNTHWTLEKVKNKKSLPRVRLKFQQKCLGVREHHLAANPCTKDKDFQIWTFDYEFNTKLLRNSTWT